MHDYEVLKYGGIALVGATFMFLLPSMTGTLVGTLLCVYGVSAAATHHHSFMHHMEGKKHIYRRVK